MKLFPSLSRENLAKTKYTRLLSVLIFLLVSSPFLYQSKLGAIIGGITFLSTVLVIISTFHLKSISLKVNILLAILSFSCETLARSNLINTENEKFFFLCGRIIDIVFISLAIYVICKRIVNDNKVGSDTIKGGICVYLLIGILWAFLYEVFFLTNSDSFSENILYKQEINYDLKPFLYYSFTTLTTLGYGDIVPQTYVAMMFSNLEAIVGQLYPAIIIARLVGLYTAEEMSNPED
ncbi:MAG: ion channel [Cyanobacteria bacterium J06592_8]